MKLEVENIQVTPVCNMSQYGSTMYVDVCPWFVVSMVLICIIVLFVGIGIGLTLDKDKSKEVKE